MAVSATTRKPLGIRATPKEHAIIRRAAAREGRSVNSFVLNVALRAAREEMSPVRTPEAVQAAIDRAQALMRRHRSPGESLVDQLIAERRAEAARE